MYLTNQGIAEIITTGRIIPSWIKLEVSTQ